MQPEAVVKTPYPQIRVANVISGAEKSGESAQHYALRHHNVGDVLHLISFSSRSANPYKAPDPSQPMWRVIKYLYWCALSFLRCTQRHSGTDSSAALGISFLKQFRGDELRRPNTKFSVRKLCYALLVLCHIGRCRHLLFYYATRWPKSVSTISTSKVVVGCDKFNKLHAMRTSLRKNDTTQPDKQHL